ncbi:DNA repair protein RadA [Candidatus Sulfidibacterium hydrothermale]|uniref:DNA repair protein RadA n=1 Tax=Candidatus Sulfidibacterium hydrothermale TaxID=2875962 RepID=UPI001F0A4DD5|nr:DNA repair protein RadA [Candidatus Sulfidibacterium hydrothermale]UBM62942.1 DNA repair protein RadA [Candidatus Sulfidibacterium hydrothermale]
MAKTKTVFYCQNCGYQASKWLGKCPACGEWNTFVEEVISKADDKKKGVKKGDKKAKPVPIGEITSEKEDRINTQSTELNRVLGGGLVSGSVVLVGGEPGIGKSTLLLQTALKMKGHRILYVSGEESLQQIKMRADRIGIQNESCFLLNETFTTDIFKQIESLEPDILIIDSIQTLYSDTLESSPGSISQIRETAGELMRFAKTTQVPVFLIGHITKEGNLAGPKVLEHMVDTVLQFEGDRHYGFRILRSMKNRFGSTSELGIFEMHAGGLREVQNPSDVLLSQRDEATSGIAIAAMIEGQRPLLIETQALVTQAAYGTPQRSATGFDLRRMNMLLAVLEKRSGFKLGTKDVFLNIAGGIRVDDPAIDLAVVAAILSSTEDLAIDSQVCFAAEVGLSGEIRAVTRVENRITEAEKLGFDKIILSKYSLKGLDKKQHQIEIVGIGNIEDLLQELFG